MKRGGLNSKSAVPILPRRARKFLLILPAILLPFGALVLEYGPYTFSHASICTDCGMVRQTQERKLPLTEFTWRSHSRENHTPVSELLCKPEAIGSHAHRWLFARGSGNGIQ